MAYRLPSSPDRDWTIGLRMSEVSNAASLFAKELTSCSQPFLAQIGTSYAPTVATSYWPAWVAMSWVTLSRSSFSGSTVKFTAIPVSLVKLSLVSF